MAYTDEEVYAVWNKCGGRCVYGQRKRVLLSDYGITWEIDHATSLSHGGVNDARNWRVACVKHNRQKGGLYFSRRDYERWLEANPWEKACGW